MDIKRYYGFKQINWAALPELSARLARNGISLIKASVELETYSESVTHDSVEVAAAAVLAGYEPTSYSIFVCGNMGELPIVITLSRYTTLHSQRIQSIKLVGSTDESILQSMAAFLGLPPDEKPPSNSAPIR